MNHDITKTRADLGFVDALDDFDPAEWTPTAATANDKPPPPRAATRKAAAAAGFRSREPQAVASEIDADVPAAARNESGIASAASVLTATSTDGSGENGRGAETSASLQHGGTMSSASLPVSMPYEPPSIATPAVTNPPVIATPIASAPAQVSSPTDARPDPYRRRRTGRSTQLSIKARPETVAAFYAVADRHGWVLGEALERAVALLEREHGRDGGSGETAASMPHDRGAPCS